MSWLTEPMLIVLAWASLLVASWGLVWALWRIGMWAITSFD
jgi:hypothetical protein